MRCARLPLNLTSTHSFVQWLRSSSERRENGTEELEIRATRRAPAAAASAANEYQRLQTPPPPPPPPHDVVPLQQAATPTPAVVLTIDSGDSGRVSPEGLSDPTCGVSNRGLAELSNSIYTVISMILERVRCSLAESSSNHEHLRRQDEEQCDNTNETATRTPGKPVTALPRIVLQQRRLSST